MKIQFKIALVSLLVVLAAGCSTFPPEPIVDYNPDYNFSGIRTYRIVHDESVNSMTLEGARIEKAIKNEMAMKGVQEVASGEDMQLRFMLVLKEKQDIQTYDRFYGGGFYNCWRCGYGGFATTDIQVREYTEGQLVIDMVDPKLKRSIWHTVSTGRIKEKITPQERNERIQAIVASMFSHYPPGADTP